MAPQVTVSPFQEKADKIIIQVASCAIKNETDGIIPFQAHLGTWEQNLQLK